MNIKSNHLFSLFLFLVLAPVAIFAGDTEFFGQFDKTLVPNTEDFEKVIFKFTAPGKLKGETAFGQNAHLAAGKLYDPQTGKFSVSALLVEETDEDENEKNPAIFVDLDGDGKFSDGEKFTFEPKRKRQSVSLERDRQSARQK